MKKVLAIIVSLVLVVSFAGLSFAAEKAADKKAPAMADKKAPAMEEKKAPAMAKKATVKQVTGEVAAVDAMAKTITVKAKKGETTVTADDKTKVMMGKEKKTIADVKVGDKVTVKYSEADGKMVAKSVAIKAAEMKKEPAREGSKEG